MIIKCDVPIQASVDDGLTVTTFEPGEAIEVPGWVGKMAIKHYGAEEVKKPKPESKEAPKE